MALNKVRGNHHLKYVQVCDCEPHAVTLLKCQFWPGSPANSTIGLSFKLMEFVENVFLHCQVSLLNITEVITELSPQLQPTHVFHASVQALYKLQWKFVQ
ncbi:uncharacterized protein LOC111342623 isoform X2 [Stylophora pistillata]|uniref:uncharacterized protein LOC111342623 isoform X2 n=1 Tax=Stylophora pistillata TaxID=50429 RepID=UPI000C0396D3|nr:uncharacterized protein LOC111342623 isoform X2 [Stylophora pistillata]